MKYPRNADKEILEDESSSEKVVVNAMHIIVYPRSFGTSGYQRDTEIFWAISEISILGLLRRHPIILKVNVSRLFSKYFGIQRFGFVSADSDRFY